MNDRKKMILLIVLRLPVGDNATGHCFRVTSGLS